MSRQFLILIISTAIILCNKVVISNIVFYVRIYVDIRICLTLDIWPWFHFLESGFFMFQTTDLQLQ